MGLCANSIARRRQALPGGRTGAVVRTLNSAFYKAGEPLPVSSADDLPESLKPFVTSDQEPDNGKPFEHYRCRRDFVELIGWLRAHDRKIRSLLTRPLGLLGWERLEPVLLATLTTGEPLLLIGRHGPAESFLLEWLAQALGLVYRF